MIVCFFIAGLEGFGGTERASSTIASALADFPEITEVVMLGLMGSTNCSFALDKRVRTDSLFPTPVRMTSRYHQAVCRLRKFLRNNRIDVLVVVESTLSLYAIPARLGFNTRLICWEHFNFLADVGRKKRVLARHLAALLMDDVVTLTQRDRVLWQQRTIARARVHTIANPSPKPGCEAPYPIGSRIVLAVGRLNHQKGFDMLLDAWTGVVQRGKAGEWKLLIVGSGEQLSALEQQIRRDDLTSSVMIRPATLEIADQYRRAGIVCCSSRYEGLPMVLIEAQQYGRPVVSFDIDTGPREIVVDGETGVLVPPGNVSLLADALCELMDDEDKRTTMSANAVIQSTKFCTETIVERWRILLAPATSKAAFPGEEGKR